MPRWVTVNTEGCVAGLFDQEENTERADNANSVSNEIEVPSEVMQAGNHSEDIAMVRAAGLNVDDDNDPAPESIPDSTVITVDGGKWG